MSKNDFLQALKKSKDDSKDLPGLNVLQEFCDAIKQFVGESIACDAVPANSVNYGQEYKVIITYYPSSYSSTLLRAYLNKQGKPYLDVYDQKGPRACKDVQDLRQKLREFLTGPGVAEMLQRFRRDSDARQ
jgi:hypothetical protein